MVETWLSLNAGHSLAGTGVTIVASERTFLWMCKSFLIHSSAIWPNSMTDVGKEISKTLLRTYRAWSADLKEQISACRLDTWMFCADKYLEWWFVGKYPVRWPAITLAPMASFSLSDVILALLLLPLEASILARITALYSAGFGSTLKPTVSETSLLFARYCIRGGTSVVCLISVFCMLLFKAVVDLLIQAK